MRVDNFKRIKYLMKNESALFGRFLSEGSVNLAISIGTD